MAESYTIKFENPKESAAQIAQKLNSLHSALEISVVKDAVSRSEFEKHSGMVKKYIESGKDRINMNDQRWHGGGITPNGVQTISNKRITRRVVPVTQSATPAINTDITDVASITGLAQAITSFTTNLTGSPNAGDYLMIQITDNGTARGLTWGSSFESTTVTLPTTTVISTMLRVGFQWNPVTLKWSCIATA